VSLQFGYNAGLQEGRTVAWGARLIVTQDGHVDFVHDRQSLIGPDEPRRRLLDYLNGNDIPIERRIADMLQRGVMRTSVAQEFTVCTDGVVVIKANTNASCGYCYVVAYFAQAADEAVQS
jgi:hypothetical protein